jgi:transposase-like protein
MSLLSLKHLQAEQAAYDWVEAQLWPDGPVCPYCKGTGRISKMQGKSTRIGFYKCYVCRKKFNVKIGTIFEASHVRMHLWLQAFHLMAGSKKGISANQLHRTLKVTLKTAWFMGHRIREAMRSGSLAPPMGGDGTSGIVEADETFTGRKKGVPKPKGGYKHKNAILSLVERGGRVRSVHVPDVKAATLVPIVNENIAKEARVMTDDTATYYNKLDDFAGHDAVNHSAKEYVRYDGSSVAIHTNTVESYFSVFKRGMRGVYQHCDEKHLHRHLSEFDFRHNNRVALGVNDEQRAATMVKGVKGKRLTYRPTDWEVNDNAEAQGS